MIQVRLKKKIDQKLNKEPIKPFNSTHTHTHTPHPHHPSSITITVCISRLIVSNSLRPHGRYPPLFMEFSKQKYWSELPFPSPGDLPYPGIDPRSPALQEDSLPSELYASLKLYTSK